MVRVATPVSPPAGAGIAGPLRRVGDRARPGVDLVRVYLVDDHELVRHGVTALLDRAGGFETAGQAGTVADALRGIAATRPDVVLCDLRLPDGDGLEMIREIRSRDLHTRCLILTSFPSNETLAQAVVAGAAGYLSKTATPEEVVAAVRAVAAGRSLLDEELARLQVDMSQGSGDDVLDGLTPQERRILDFITQGLTNLEIAEELGLAEKTIRNYVSNLLGRLGMKNRTQVAVCLAQRAAAGRIPSLTLDVSP
ncbi:MAG TPA: response regulator transcription factor [Nitriliruptorales bacterium]|nr:response regulator transcription factor [Nitriliruptorales bacterium]